MTKPIVHRVPPALERVRIPRKVMDQTLTFMRQCGAEFKEGMALWAGTVQDDRHAEITTLILPQQNAVSSPLGGHLSLPLAARQQLTRQLDAKNELLLAQVHSHPGEAFHSETDSLYPILLHEGAISVVIPDFGNIQFKDFSEVAILRLRRWPHWKTLTAPERDDLFEVTP